MKAMTTIGARALLAFLLLGLGLAAGCVERDQAAEPKTAESKPADRGGDSADHAKGDNDAAGDEHGREAEGKEEGVELSPERLRAQGVVVAPLEPQPVAETIRAPAEIGYNEDRRVAITARAGGWAERVEAYANERVRANELLAEIYSPEFASAQQEYLLIRDRAALGGGESGAATLLADAEQRLRLLGLTDEEIEALARTRKPYPFLHVHSPIAGTVVEHELNTGDNVQPGQPLYVIANLSSVWASVSLTESQLGRVRPGQPVTLTVKAYPSEGFRGQILSLGANMDPATRTVKARALIRNPGERLRPGMFADAEIPIGDGAKALSLPEDAVLRSADGDWVIYVEEEPGHFKPMEVKILRNAGDRVVIDGVKPGTRVVTKGAFFVQSELAKGGFETHNH